MITKNMISLQSRLSAVGIVFLYRLVQEITAYFTGLATPHAEEVVKYVDKVGGFKWLIDKNEVAGAGPFTGRSYNYSSKEFYDLFLKSYYLLRLLYNPIWSLSSLFI